jgi:tetratricopeptide (TPR) repeat protein
VTEQLELPAPDMAPSTPVTEPVTDPQPASVAAPATSLESDAGKSAYESLAAAREAYWLRDYEGAENHYRLLIQLEPDNPDWYGELGNMYFAQGQWQQAAAVYYEAGVRLLNDGKVVQASQMVDVIRGLNGVEADDLEEQINASQVAP